MLPIFAAIALSVIPSTTSQEPASLKTISFPSSDGLEITADLYLAHEDPKTPLIVLFHQANSSRGEYREIAPSLNRMGFNCMAVDQRSGSKMAGVKNETAARAEKEDKGTSYVDALPDLVTSLTVARKRWGKGKIIAWGSSYSAGLVLHLASDQPRLADAVLSFAPGEYYTRSGKPGDWIAKSTSKIEVPTFITSAKNEHQQWKNMFEGISKDLRTSYLPESAGRHGSRALWKETPDHAGYWEATSSFLMPFMSKKSKEMSDKEAMSDK